MLPQQQGAAMPVQQQQQQQQHRQQQARTAPLQLEPAALHPAHPALIQLVQSLLLPAGAAGGQPVQPLAGHTAQAGQLTAGREQQKPLQPLADPALEAQGSSLESLAAATDVCHNLDPAQASRLKPTDEGSAAANQPALDQVLSFLVRALQEPRQGQ
jgi:hypothetical protein